MDDSKIKSFPLNIHPLRSQLNHYPDGWDPLSDTSAGDPVPPFGTLAGDPFPLSDPLVGVPFPLSDTLAGVPFPLSDTIAGVPFPLSDTLAGDPVPPSDTLAGEPVPPSDTSAGDSDSSSLPSDPGPPHARVEGTPGYDLCVLVLLPLCLACGIIALALLLPTEHFTSKDYHAVRAKYIDLWKYNRMIDKRRRAVRNDYDALQSKYDTLEKYNNLMERRIIEYKKNYEELQQCEIDLVETSAILEAFRESAAMKRCMTCRLGWKNFNGKCYLFSDDKMSWEQSRDDCVTRGGHLVIVSTTEEQRFIESEAKKKMKYDSDHSWIGLTDSEIEGQWLWVDNTLLDPYQRFWLRMEPDDWKGRYGEFKYGEDCARTGTYGCAISCWGDSNCNIPMRRICEAKGL